MKMPLPDSIKNAPALDFGNELFLTAFNDLTSCRSIGNGEGPIPFYAIMDYCACFGIEGEQQDELLYHVRKLDNAYLKFRAEKRKEQQQH